jgi:uncharacterized protein (DUF1800 family)
VAGSDSEIEAGAIEDTGGHRNPELMGPKLDATAVASHAGLSPRFAAAAAVVARATHRHLERHHRAVARLAMRQSDRRAQRSSPLVHEERAPHTIDGGRHRWKINDDLIRKAICLWTAVGSTDDGHRSGAEGTKGITAHEQS